ncbi:VacJ family lipoprotein [Celeribacter sp.]|uniref:MlaA family lipoprotein n=1 Tax=Celeribacter sp. TaxID=1890673 RepID=UPI003A91A3E0
MKKLIFPLVVTASLAGCAAPAPVDGIADPYEVTNRKIHALNVSADRALIKPASTAYGTLVPAPVVSGITNVSRTLSLPGVVVNNVLQLRIDEAIYNTLRFTVNATFGIGGLLDVAGAFGLDEHDTDFGETLHRWGVGEGSYVVLPLYGPSTQRDAFGLLVDIALDPVSLLETGIKDYKLPLTVAGLADARYRYSDLYESVVYDSADSYALMRVTYLDKRRYELIAPLGGAKDDTGGANGGAVTYDIYEDFYE